MVSRPAKPKRTDEEILKALPKLPEMAGFKPIGLVVCNCGKRHKYVLLRCAVKIPSPLQLLILTVFTGAVVDAPELSGMMSETRAKAEGYRPA